MAENKKGFILYADQISIFDKLTEQEAGKLIKHIFKYVNDENPVMDDRFLDLAFEPIKLQLKRDLKKYESIKVKRSEAGKISAENKKKQASTNSTSVESVQQASTNSTVKDNVNGTVNVNDNVSVIKGNTPTLDFFFKDLPTSSNFENISMTLNIPKEKLILRIPEFRKSAKVDYPNFNEFCNHFKNWVKIESKKAPLPNARKIDRS